MSVKAIKTIFAIFFLSFDVYSQFSKVHFMHIGDLILHLNSIEATTGTCSNISFIHHFSFYI